MHKETSWDAYPLSSKVCDKYRKGWMDLVDTRCRNVAVSGQEQGVNLQKNRCRYPDC